MAKKNCCVDCGLILNLLVFEVKCVSKDGQHNKLCSKCQIVYSLEKFYFDKKRNSYDSHCKICRNKHTQQYNAVNRDKIRQTELIWEQKNKEKCVFQRRRWRQANAERISKRNQQYRETNKEKLQQLQREWYASHKKESLAYSKLYRAEARLFALTQLSGGLPFCQCCGETILAFLTIDHINGGGADHRRELKGKGNSLYYWLIKNNFPPGFQVLCHNCNKGKGIREHCPHKIGHEKDLSTGPQRAAYKLRKDVLTHYNNNNIIPYCACCGEDGFLFLSIDHVNGRGKQHLRDLNIHSSNFYRWLRTNKYPNDPPLQVLCHNCNFAKGSRSTCPHQT